MKQRLARALRRHPRAFNMLRALHHWRDAGACLDFVRDPGLPWSRQKRLKLVRDMYRASFGIDTPHTQQEILGFIQAMLKTAHRTHGVIVEAGCYKGSSTAKISLVANRLGRSLVVFDSFKGIPENDEPHARSIFGYSVEFKPGDYCGQLEEVRRNVARFGGAECCRFVEGWFDDTMPGFREPISAIYLDVDLASSTRTCLKHLYPLLEPGGVLCSQDGHLPLVIDVFRDESFWREEVGCPPPAVQGLGRRKLITIVKEPLHEFGAASLAPTR